MTITVSMSHSFKYESSEAETKNLLSVDQLMSEIPCLCPVIDLSKVPLFLHNLITLSAAKINSILYECFENQNNKIVAYNFVNY